MQSDLFQPVALLDSGGRDHLPFDPGFADHGEKLLYRSLAQGTFSTSKKEPKALFFSLSINPRFCISRREASAFIQTIPCAIFFLLVKGAAPPLQPLFFFETFQKARKSAAFQGGSQGGGAPLVKEKIVRKRQKLMKRLLTTLCAITMLIYWHRVLFRQSGTIFPGAR